MHTNKNKEDVVLNKKSNIGIKTEGNMSVTGNIFVNTSADHFEKPPVVEFYQIDSPTAQFTGRKDLLKKIHNRMQACLDKSDLRERIVVLCGLGGIGKTEAARMYAYKYLKDPIIQNVAWMDAKTLTTLKDGVDSLAYQLKIPINNVAVSVIVDSIYKHFSDHIEAGLFIFDNANQFNDIEFGIHEYLPNLLALKRRPLILITSRDIKWDIPEKNIIRVDDLTEGESVDLVIKKLGMSEPEQTVQNKHEIVKLAHSLQGFPLGLCLAACNISYRNEEYFENQVASYIKRMQTPNGGWIKDSQTGALTKYTLVMENVWDTTLAKIERSQGGSDALKLLNLMAFLPTDGITVETMSDLFSFAFGKPVTEKEYSILENKSIVVITKVATSLAVSASTSRSKSQIKIHRLVQHSMREKLDAQEDFSYLQHVCNYLSHMRLQNEEHYSTSAALCAHEHLKNRKWPFDFIHYSVMFCSFMTFFESKSLESTFQIFEDVYELLNVKHLTTEDFKREKNAINLFSLCVLWRNKNNKDEATRLFSLLANPKLSAEYFEETLLSLKRPSSKISLMPKMEPDDLLRNLYSHCYQKLHSLYKFTQIRWSRQIEGFPRKLGHAAVAVENQIFSFGGRSDINSSEPDSPMDIFVLNLDKTEIKWKQIKPNQSSPSTSTITLSQRINHTSVFYKNNVIIYGGSDSKSIIMNSVCRFNVKTRKWDKPNVTGTLPEARPHHSAFAIRNEMIIFGGWSSPGMYGGWNTSNDVHSLNMDSSIWSNITTIKGFPPTRRWGHSAVVDKNNFIYIFGGYDCEEYFNDLICLDWNTKEWTRSKTIGTIPLPRYRHSAFMHKGLMYIFGGKIGNDTHVTDLFSYNPETCEWKEVKTIGKPPSPRGLYKCVALNNSVYIFGGLENGRNAVYGTYVLDLE